MIFLVPVAIGLGAWRYHVNKTRKGMTPERKALFAVAMRTWKNPAKLNKLADMFDKEDLSKEAGQLRARAKLPESKEIQEKINSVVKLGLKSDDPQSIRFAANKIEAKGATASATTLRQYANGIEVAKTVIPVSIPKSEATPAPSPNPDNNPSQTVEHSESPPNENIPQTTEGRGGPGAGT